MVYRFRTVPIPGYEEYGMRDDGWNPSARRTIAVLGDSYTFGATVAGEDIWCEQIESRNPGVDMLNIAMGSGVAKAVAEYTVLKDRLPLHDAVVYEMYLGNEFLDNDVFAEAMKHVDEEIAVHASSYRRARILSSSKLLFAAARVASRIKWAILGARNRPTEYVAEEDGYWDERFGNFLLKPKNPILLRYAEPVYTDNRITHGIEETEKNLVHLKELVGSRKFVVLLFPFKEMIHFDAIRHQMPDLDITRPSRIVLDLCRKHGITCMDLTAGLLAHRNERLNWDYDHHLNKVGQYYASLEAERALHGLGLLSGQP